MSIEKIKKAIQGSAEGMASRESLEKPNSRHFEQAFNLYRQIKSLDINLFKSLITVAAKGKELKDKMGPKLDKIFSSVWNEQSSKYENEIVSIIINEINKNRINQKERLHKIYEDIKNKILNDSRIISAFSGKEKLLQEVIECSISEVQEILLLNY